MHPWLRLRHHPLHRPWRAGASGALNMWYDADIDAADDSAPPSVPVPSGAILNLARRLGFGMALAVASVLMLGLLVSMWPRPPCFSPSPFCLLCGDLHHGPEAPHGAEHRHRWCRWCLPADDGSWCAVTGTIDPGAIALFMLIFMWTPPHFWALALYPRGATTATPVCRCCPTWQGRAATKNQILIYSLHPSASTALRPVRCFTGTAGWLYAAGAAVLTVQASSMMTVWQSGGRRRRVMPRDRADKVRLFRFSILWLFALFALILAEKLIGIASHRRPAVMADTCCSRFHPMI